MVWRECLKMVLNENGPKCLLDKKPFAWECNRVNSFATNFLRRDLVEESEWGWCQTHKRKNEFSCEVEKTLVCSNCLILIMIINSPSSQIYKNRLQRRELNCRKLLNPSRVSRKDLKVVWRKDHRVELKTVVQKEFQFCSFLTSHSWS